MQIHLAKPGGEKIGPYTLEQINQDLAGKKYRDTDYWAWYEGADAWVPLYEIPGISQAARSSLPVRPAPEPEQEEPALAPAPEAEEAPTPAKSQVSSGLPVTALEQIFFFTKGEGPALLQSRAIVGMLQEIIGEDWTAIREKVPRDVFSRCDIGEQVRRDGKVPAAAWRAMSALKPALIKQAHDGTYRTCVRTFATEAGEPVAVFLFYNKKAE
jgi:hypothetical protein